MMRLYAVVIILAWALPFTGGDLSYANSGLSSVPGTVNDGNLDSNEIKVDLSGNSLSSFVSDLTCCTLISELDLTGNSLTTVTISRASGLVITKLTLSNNQLSTSPTISTSVANKLVKLYIGDNQVASMDSTLLSSLLLLDTLYMPRNSLTIFPDLSAATHTLTQIDFEANSIVDPSPIHNIAALQRIILSQNSITTFPTASGRVSNDLTFINLYENQITAVPDVDLAAFAVLEYMDISRNRLTQFPNISVVGNTMKTLYAWGNSISTIDPSCFNNVNVLEFLSLAGNGLTDFPDMGPTVGQTLLTLELNHNGFTDFGDKLYNLEALTRLDLQVNSLTNAPNISTSNPINLILSQNSISGVAGLAGKKISHLDLSNNQVTTLTGLTGLEATLQELNLNNNPIASVDYSALSGYVLLNTLDLSYATFSSIPDLTDVSPLLTLKMEGVPLVCDCNARWLTLWTTSAAGRTLVVSTNPCQQPANLQNVAWASVSLDVCPVVTTIEYTSTVQDEPTTVQETTTVYIASTAADEITTVDTVTTEQTTAAQEPGISTTQQTLTTQDTFITEETTIDTSQTTTASNAASSTVSSTTPTGCDANTESSLIANLLTNYDISARPVLNESDAVVVKLGLVLQQIISLNAREQELLTKVWMRYTWTDEGLTWNKSGSCDSIRIFPYRIWRPDITLYDDLNTDPNDNDAKLFPADVQSDGTVTWNIPRIIRSKCDVDMRYYPWDEQKCILKFGSWTYDIAALDLLNKTASGDLTYYSQSGEWSVIDFSVKRNNILYNCCPNSYPDVTFTLQIRRKASYYLFNIILPAIFITATSILVFYLPPESGEKVSLGVTVLLSLTVFLLLVGETVPKTETIPLISQYFEATIIMMALSSALTVITLNIHHRGMFGREVPLWVRKLVLDWMARPLCLKSLVDGNISQIRSNRVSPLKSTKQVQVEDGIGSEDGVILVQEKAEETVLKHNRTDAEQSLHDILSVLLGFQEVKQATNDKESCMKDWKMVALVIDRFLLFLFIGLTVGVSALILLNHPYYNEAAIA